MREVAAMLGIAPVTLRNYCRDGKYEFTLTPGGQRVFTQEQVDQIIDKPSDIVIGYVRSSSGQKASIESQKDIIHSVYPDCDIIKDTGSGLSEKRRGLKSLLAKVKKGQYNVVVVDHSDRLTRFGKTYLEELINAYGGRVVYLSDNKDESLQEELMSDFMSLIASFSGKFYRLRGYDQQRKLLERAQEELGDHG